MNQQRDALVRHIIKMFQLSAIVSNFVSNLCPPPRSSLSYHFDQRPSAGCLTNCYSDIASTYQRTEF